MESGARRGQRWQVQKMSEHGPRGAPSVLTFPLLLLPPSAFPPANVTMVGPHPSEEGRGTVWLKLRGQERAVATRANVVVEVEQSSTVHTVDD